MLNIVGSDACHRDDDADILCAINEAFLTRVTIMTDKSRVKTTFIFSHIDRGGAQFILISSFNHTRCECRLVLTISLPTLSISYSTFLSFE
jgi:hypothetical protein